MSRRRLALAVLAAGTACTAAGCSGTAAPAKSIYPISGPACAGGWECLTASAGAIGYPILGPAAGSGATLNGQTVSVYELTPGAIEVGYTYNAQPGWQQSVVREVRGGQKPMCATVDGATKVTVRGTVGFWLTHHGPNPRLCWTDETWSSGIGFPPGTNKDQAIAAVDALVEYKPALPAEGIAGSQ